MLNESWPCSLEAGLPEAVDVVFLGCDPSYLGVRGEDLYRCINRKLGWLDASASIAVNCHPRDGLIFVDI